MTPSASYEVRLTLGAEGDLQALYDHVFEYRSPAQADGLLSALLEAVESLEHFPERGVVPKELAALGVRDYRQILLPPYRIIYRVIETTVYILVIADGRRDMQSLLERRLLR
jgi:toxin ParE1/3/4